jgi:tRNA (cmo5U34)-methyltransferase
VVDSPRSVEAFRAQAERYDSDAELLMGDRPLQRQYLEDVLRCLPDEPRAFVDLGCGTGYFTEVIFETFPLIRGKGIDGSEAMLERARSRFQSGDRDLELRCELLQSVDWSTLGATQLVFSAFAIHHLSDDEKRGLFRQIFEHIEPNGRFILFDSFRPDDPIADELVERLTCLDIQRRVRDAKGTEVPLERIIARDREVKAAEGDQEASFEAQLRWLREVGFESVAPVFLDVRMGGVVAAKSQHGLLPR